MRVLVLLTLVSLLCGCATAGSGGFLARRAPENPESRCTVSVEGGGDVRLVLEGIPWPRWGAACQELVRYLRPGPPPFEERVPGVAEVLLVETGYFETARCHVENEGRRLSCTLRPQRMVREIDITGRIPVGVLREELRRRMFVAEGALLVEEAELFERQADRLVHFLERDGFFGSRVDLGVTEIGRAEPNLGVRLDVRIEAGRTTRLRDVEIEGDPPIPENEVESAIRHFGLLWFFQRRFRPERFDDDLDGLAEDLHRRGWPEARVTGTYRLDPDEDYVDAVVRIDPGPRLVLRFEGNRALSDRRLEGLATFAEAGIIDPVEVETTVRAMRAAYQDAGRPFVVIEVESAQPDPMTIALVFRIQEGPAAAVAEVTFTGNTVLTDREIRREAELLTRRTRLLSPGRWVDAAVAADETAIVDLYRRLGYGAATARAERIRRPDGDLDVIFQIEEGPRRTVRALTLAGLPEAIDDEALLGRLRLVVGAPFDPAFVVQDRNEVLATLAAEGYALADVTEIVQAPTAEEGGPVQIELSVEPGVRTVHGGFLVRGNFRTRASLIEEQLGLNPGDTLDLVALGEARRRLRGLGAFTSVDLSPLGLWREDPETWQLVAVQERRPRTLDVVVAFATDEGLTAGADYRDRNLFGRAIFLDARLRVGRAFGLIPPSRFIGLTDRADITGRAPRPFGLPFDVDGNLFYRYSDQPTYLEERLGIGAGASRQILSRVRCAACPDVLAQLRYEVTGGRLDARVAEEQPPDIEDDPEAALAADRANVGRIAPVLLFDRRDSFVDPLQGWAGDLRFELASRYFAPIPDGHNFWRVLLNLRGYLNLGTPFERPLGAERFLGGPVVVAAAAGHGIARPLGPEPGLPDADALYYGGDFSVRGLEPFASAVAFPGANYRVTGTLELRWYVARNIFLGSFQLAGFLDFGAVSYAYGDLFAEPALTAGPLLRYVTPVGPISLGWGFPLVRPDAIVEIRPEAAPAGGRLHLTFGYPF